MKSIYTKLFIAAILLMNLFYLGIAYMSKSNVATATEAISKEWTMEKKEEVSRDGFNTYVMTDPENQTEYIVIYRYNANAGVSLAITPRIKKYDVQP